MRTRSAVVLAAVMALCAACTAGPPPSRSGTAASVTVSTASPPPDSGTTVGASGPERPGATSSSGAASASPEPSVGAGAGASPATSRPTGEPGSSSRPGPTPSSPRSGPATRPLTPWPTYHGDVQRTGRAAASAAPTGALTVATVRLDGAVYASPIVAAGNMIVATEHNSVYALDATGDVRWHITLGAPTPRSGLPCGNIDPLGITGTPYYDEPAHTVFVVASIGPTANHVLFAIDPANGRVRWQQSVDLPGVDHLAMQQRGALTVAQGRVWVPFGGLAGDCGDYRGRLVGVPVGGGSPVAFTVPTGREGGIWAPPGPVVDGGDLLVAVGNGESTGGTYDHSDSVLRLQGTTIVDSFSPTTWASDNASDLDLGSQAPTLVADGWIFQAGKSGTAYVLRADHLGGIGGAVTSAPLCRSFGGTAVVGDVVYVPCTTGVAAVHVGRDGTMTELWRAARGIAGSPVTAGDRVYALDTTAGRLAVLDPATGATLESVAVGACNRFATPAISGGRIYVGTLAGLSIVTGTRPPAPAAGG